MKLLSIMSIFEYIDEIVTECSELYVLKHFESVVANNFLPQVFILYEIMQ